MKTKSIGPKEIEEKKIQKNDGIGDKKGRKKHERKQQ